ncbi:hypothetical protein ACOTTU_08645 [Roseobacter sp. EG26]|uniref:hypothetical protein n=1 Tax=Roseobacter sp. EG26 TaxID=3412477 RepID=UPI003CE4B0A0
MKTRDREFASELDLTRMVMRPQSSPSVMRWPFVVMVLLSLLTASVIWAFYGGDRSEIRSAAVRQGDAAAQQEVSRSAPSLLELTPALPLSTGEPVSHQLRLPLRLTDRTAQKHNLPYLTSRALARFNHETTPGDVLHDLLVQTLAEGQSDAYVNATLNSALSQGAFASPIGLTTPFGEIDTARLLAAVLAEAKN